MKAVVFHDVGDIRLQEVKDPVIQDSKDVIVQLTASAICGTDLHMVRGTMPGMKKGTILGHEGVGIVIEKGTDVHTLSVGDRVVIPSTICCGHCAYCDRKLFSQCDNANPNGPDAGTAFFGGPETSGPFNGLQAEKARIPFADANLIKIGDLKEEHVILLSDILPTAYQAVEYIEPQPDDTVAVFGSGPVGQLVIASLKLKGVKKIFAIDRVPERLKKAEAQGAIIINFDQHDPVSELRSLTNNKGPTKIIDAVGIDAQKPQCCGLNYLTSLFKTPYYKAELKMIAPKTNPQGSQWVPGDAPSQVFEWAVQAIAKAGILSIIGVYTPLMFFFPVGACMQKDLTIRMGNCNHRAYFPLVLDWLKNGTIDTAQFISHKIPFDEVIDAYKHFDKRDDGWIKVMLMFPERKA